MKNKKLFVNVFCIVMACVMCFGLMHPIVANAGAREDYAAAQEKLDQINRTISSLKDTKKKQEKELSSAKTQSDLVKKQISILNSDIKTANENLLAKQEELENKKEDIQATDELFKERLKAMYIMRSGGTLSTILAVDSFSQLLTAADTLQRISIADTDLLKELNEQKKVIEQEEVAIQQRLNDLVEKQGTLETKQNELAALLKKLEEHGMTQLGENHDITLDVSRRIYEAAR